MVRPSIALIGAAALALVIGGCEKQAKSDPDAAKNAIKADEKRWNQEFQAKDVEAAMSHYADDAFLVAPGVKGTVDRRRSARLSPVRAPIRLSV